MASSKSRLLSAFLVTALFVFSSCAVSPLTRSYTKWSAESCGRQNFGSRLCSSLVTFVTLPAIVFTFVADMPLSMIEFFGGGMLVNDPLVKTAMNDYEKKTFAGNDHDTWSAQRRFDQPDAFDVEHVTADGTIERFAARSGAGRRYELSRVN